MLRTGLLIISAAALIPGGGCKFIEGLGRTSPAASAETPSQASEAPATGAELSETTGEESEYSRIFPWSKQEKRPSRLNRSLNEYERGKLLEYENESAPSPDYDEEEEKAARRRVFSY